MFSFVTKVHKTKNCLGTRTILEEHEEVQADGKTIKKYIMGDYKWRSFRDAELEATHFGRGVRELGVIPRERVAIFAETRAEWMIAAQGLFKHSCGVATIYATLGEDGITHAINQTEVSVIITSHDLMPKLKNVIHTVPKITTVIYFDDQLNSTDVKGLEDWKVFGYKEVVEIGKASNFGKFGRFFD
jgi:long-chain acyl-CoA synthetase